MKRIAVLALSSLLFAAAAGAQPTPVSKGTAIQQSKLVGPTPVIKQSTLSEKDLAEVQELLKGINPASFNAVISSPGKGTVRLGNAAIKDLATKSVVHAPGARPSAADEIATTTSNVLKVIWTGNMTGADKVKMDRVNALLAR